jgi:hypothetical protein
MKPEFPGLTGPALGASSQDAEAQFGADLIAGDIEKLRTAVHATLRTIEQPEPKPRETYGAQGAEEHCAKLLYFICDERDRKASVPLRKLCRHLGFEVALPAFEGDAARVREANQQNLADCDIVLLYYGAGDAAWKRAIGVELKKMAGYRAGKPLPAMFVYLAEPRTGDKEDLIDMEEPGVINGLACGRRGGRIPAACNQDFGGGVNETASILRTNPFPGLRPFREDEEHLFFGREKQIDAMVDKLGATRFLAVVGASGSGKSSLVNCGLRPALRRGFLAGPGTAWRIAQFRPGTDPIGAMARALAQDGALFPKDEAAGLPLAEIIETTLRMSKLGLIDMFEQARLEKGVNLLVVVDQFEELFRYRRLEPAGRGGEQRIREDAAAFVNLLLEVKYVSHPIFVVLTMRSDFVGDCPRFPGLAEAINAGQYLVPRMTRDERRAAIEGPVRVGGAGIAPVLLTRVVNDVGDNPDQLSILQHALNRTWARWQDESSDGDPLDLRHYEAIGTMANALDQHAEQAFAELSSGRAQTICERLFKALTDKATDLRGVRRPTKLHTLCALADATEAEVTEVLNVFRDPGRSFLMPPAGEALDGETVIDISHESLMRVWRRLNAWADEEARSAQTYLRLTETAALHARGKASLWRDPDLQLALNWRDINHPNETWASRYHGGFAAAMRFLTESREAREAEGREQQERRQRELAAEQEKAEAQAEYARRMRLAALLSGALALVAVLAAFAAVHVFLRESATRGIANANESRALVALSQEARLQGHYTDAVKLALAA